MKNAMLVFFVFASYCTIHAQTESPWYFTLSAGKELQNNRFLNSFYDDYKSTVLNFGVGYEHPLAKKLSLMTELRLTYQMYKAEGTRLEQFVNGGAESYRLRRSELSNFSIWSNIPIYLKYKMNERLSLTAGVFTSLHLFGTGKFTNSLSGDSGRNISRTSTREDWLEVVRFGVSAGVQYKVNDHLDLRLEMQQPFWQNSLKGLGGSKHFLRPQVSFGVNYRFDGK